MESSPETVKADEDGAEEVVVLEEERAVVCGELERTKEGGSNELGGELKKEPHAAVLATPPVELTSITGGGAVRSSEGPLP